MTDIDLLPLPEEHYVGYSGLWETRHGPYSSEQMKDYARANVARNTALLRAEIERLRTEIEALWVEIEDWKELFSQVKAHADKLAKGEQR